MKGTLSDSCAGAISLTSYDEIANVCSTDVAFCTSSSSCQPSNNPLHLSPHRPNVPLRLGIPYNCGVTQIASSPIDFAESAKRNLQKTKKLPCLVRQALKFESPIEGRSGRQGFRVLVIWAVREWPKWASRFDHHRHRKRRIPCIPPEHRVSRMPIDSDMGICASHYRRNCSQG